jgi:hypothetical protein
VGSWRARRRDRASVAVTEVESSQVLVSAGDQALRAIILRSVSGRDAGSLSAGLSYAAWAHRPHAAGPWVQAWTANAAFRSSGDTQPQGGGWVRGRREALKLRTEKWALGAAADLR